MPLSLLLKSDSDWGISLISASRKNTETNISHFQTDYHPVSVDLNIENSLIALGTACGNINLLNILKDGNSFICQSFKNLFQASPVAALCMVGDGCLVSSDPDGKVFLWNLESKSSIPQQLEPADGTVSSLIQIDGGIIVGLVDSGGILFWDIDTKKITNIIDTPPPQSSGNLYHWPIDKCLLYPTTDGRLAVYDIDNRSLSFIVPHQGQSFSLTVGSHYIYTVGSEDAVMKKFYDTSGKGAQIFTVPENIIAADIFDEDNERFILIDSEQKAKFYDVNTKKSQPTDCLSKNTYHIIKSPDSNYKRVSAAAVVKAEIEESIMLGQSQGLDHKYNRLKDLGFPLTALCLKVSAARQIDNVVDYLSALKELIDSMPQDKVGFDEYLFEYVRVLRNTWHLSEALDICRHINIDSTENAEHLIQVAEIISNDTCVIEADIEIDKLIASASVIGKKFKGLWLIDKKTSLPLRNITASMISNKYNQIRKNNSFILMPEAQIVRPFWLTKDTVGKADMVIFSKPLDMSCADLIYGIKLDKKRFGTFLTPVMLFSAGNIEKNVDFLTYNKDLENIYRNIAVNSSDCRWPDILFKTVRDAIQQVKTSAINKNIPDTSEIS